jgi:hypothetical protein
MAETAEKRPAAPVPESGDESHPVSADEKELEHGAGAGAADTALQPTTTQTTDENDDYISGFKLAAVVGSVSLVVFLLLLDQSILSTVSSPPEQDMLR